MPSIVTCHAESMGHTAMRTAIFLSCLFVLMVVTVADAGAVVLKGSVSDTEGKPVGGAMITVKASGLDSMSITTYTGNDGRFSFPDMRLIKKVAATALTVHKVGYVLDGAVKIKAQGTRQVAAIRVKGIDNVADQVPPSAWLAGFPDTPEAHTILLNCVICHQFPYGKVKNYIQKFSMLPADQREKVWYDVLKFMRVKMYMFFAELRDPEHHDKFKKLPAKFFEDDSNSILYDFGDDARMVPVLTKYMPTKFDSYPLADYEKLLAPIGGPDTVIREYQLPAPIDSNFHDNVTVHKADGTTYVYAGDMFNPRTVRLNPATGETRVIPLPKGLGGLHTLVGDSDGASWWGVFQVPGKIGRFDSETETWQTWDAGTAEMAVHSLAYKGGFETGIDVNGCVWVTLHNVNKVMRINLKTGEQTLFNAPPPERENANPVVTGVYGTVMTMDGKKVWFTQLTGSIFSVNVDTGEVEDKIVMPRGDGPRRLTIDKNDVIYVPMHGAGYLYVYDTRAKKEIGRYPLPDRAAGTYSAHWDSFRNSVWLGAENTSKMYKFDVASKSFTEYPLPPTLTRVVIRATPTDSKTGDVYLSYSPAINLKTPSVLIKLHPGDAEAAKQ